MTLRQASILAQFRWMKSWQLTHASVPTGFQGQTELHASFKGPLKDKSRLEAHLSIPVLKASYQSLQIGIPRPIRADYVNSVVTLQPADIEGTGTSLHFQGQIPVKGQAAPTLTAQGSVDLRIIRIVAPDVSSGGTVALDLRSSFSGDKPGVEGRLRAQECGNDDWRMRPSESIS